MGVDVQISEEIFVRYLIALVRDGRVVLEWVSTIPPKCLVLARWLKTENAN